MAIPAYDKFYDAILEILVDGTTHNSKETIDYCAKVFNLSEEDKNALRPSGQKILNNRIGWARFYLKKAGLIESPARGQYQITSAGKAALNDKSATLDNTYLKQFKSFREFIKTSGPKDTKVASIDDTSVSESTPQEVMASAYNEITAQLADDLMTNIMEQEPSFFERLVMDLLEKMGYGGELLNPGEVTGKSGDEGIDGIIREDALGFDKIYVQAKRWAPDRPVGEPQIQQFAGALMGKGGTKGLFITTSYFSKAAIHYVEKHMAAKIVLIDGEKLTRLMIRHGLGVNVIQTYEIKRIDSDYFIDNNV